MLRSTDGMIASGRIPGAFPALAGILLALAPVLYHGAARPAASLVSATSILLLLVWVATLPGPIVGRVVGRLAPFAIATGLVIAWSLLGAHAWSVVPDRSWDAILLACLFLVAIPAAAISSSGLAAHLLAVLGAFATFLAVFGLFSLATGTGGILLGPKEYHFGSLTGFFVNRNAAADFLVVGSLALVAGWRMSGRVTWLLPMAVTMPALVATHSRAGIAIGLASVAVAISSGWSRGRRILAFCLVSLVGLLAFAFVVLDRGEADFAASNVARLALWGDAVRAVAERPFLGWGAGTYPAVSQMLRGDGTTFGFVWESSHSVHLDFMATMGVPMAVLVVGLVCWGVVRLRRPDAPASSVAVVAIGAMVLHGALDFVPATAGVVLALAVLVGTIAGVGQEGSR